MDYKRIFILYSERSGSNLLRLLLGNHPKLTAPTAPQFWDGFSPYTHLMGDLTEQNNSYKLISIMKKYANHPFSDWNLQLTVDEIYSIHKPKCFAGIVDSLYLAKAKQEGKEGYICKETSLFDYAFFIQNSTIESHWIYLYRDPRDVVNSWMKNNMRFFTSYKAAKSWKSDQEKCLSLDLAHNLPYIDISYEEMITDTKGTITKLLNYVDLPINNDCFKNFGNKKEARKNVLWET